MRRRITPLATAALLALGLALSPSTGQAQSPYGAFGPITVWEYAGCDVGISCHRLFVSVQEIPPVYGQPRSDGRPYSGLFNFLLASEIYERGRWIHTVGVSHSAYLLREQAWGIAYHFMTAGTLPVPSVASFRVLDPPFVRTYMGVPETMRSTGLEFVSQRVVPEGERAIPLRSDIVVVATPEPSTYMLMGTGLLGVLGLARRKRKA
jgi:hypothetical protein